MTRVADQLWQIEERLWLGGAEAFRSHVDPDAVMVMPVPAGILRGQDKVLDSLNGAPRWRTVRFSDTSCRRTGMIAQLAYHASAERADQPIYTALCASTYLDDGDGWRLIAHQQTPTD